MLHHGATTDFNGIGATFKTRGVSAGYGVAPSLVDMYVHDGNIAYHAGNWDANTKYIGVEHVNSTGAPEWRIDQATFNTSVEHAAELSRRHKWGNLVPFQNLFPHGYFSPTFCPGVLKDRLQEYADAVNRLLGEAPAPVPAARKSDDELATEVMKGLWGNNPARADALRAAGYNPDAVQAVVNARINGTWQAPTAPVPSISTIARQVIAGSFGNNPERQDNLRRAGHDPDAVQAEVNRLLGVGGAPVQSGGIFAVGQNVTVVTPVDYNGAKLYVSGTYRVMEVRGDRIVIGRGGGVTA
ncbi:MAG TPA: N-acetylmuramoyl-L-alanine amidase, partial [Chitinophagales bacterium]|nr:N-acetylmuramoyl-L-alanine amidase [Chitinophagales bacterium]